MLLLLLALLCKRIEGYFKNKQKVQKRLALVDMLIASLGSNIVSNPFRDYKKPICKKILLSLLEDFNKKLKGDYWIEVKSNLSYHYLRTEALTWVKSSKWEKRFFAARTLALAPEREDENEILHLLEDTVFLVRGAAANAALTLESYPGVVKIMMLMSQSLGYEKCFYQDLLLQGSIKVVAWIMGVASKKEEGALHEAALEVLSNKVTEFPYFFLQDHLDSQSSTMRKLALKTCMNNPLHASLSLAVQLLQDPEEKVRLEAIRSLAHFETDEVFTLLQSYLEDSSIAIRLEAAYALKRMGQEGIDLLREQEVKGRQESCAVAQYVLRFD